MTTLDIQFVYYTGVKRSLFKRVRLGGSWREGKHSAEWTFQPMEEGIGEDGCPCFRAMIQLHESQLGSTFTWGVVAEGPSGSDVWAIATEVNDRRSTERVRAFQLTRQTAEQHYYLTNCRRLGANKHYGRGNSAAPGIEFAVWAPNAQRVEVVMAAIWGAGSEVPSRGPFPREQIRGGYLDRNGERALADLGPFALTTDSDGVWRTDAADPGLETFEALDHRPYMFRVLKSGAPPDAWSYRTDLYSRCQLGSGAFDPAGAPYAGPVQDLDGSVSCSVVVDPDRVTNAFAELEWPESDFVNADEFWRDEFRADRPVPHNVQDLVIYQLHVGALGFGKSTPGSLEDACGFLEHLDELGVNAVELLPMSEFAGGGGNWGYATSHHFAIEYSDGGRDQYKWFVRECHRRGIAVIVDVVYNHFAHEAERAEWMYDSDDPAHNIYYWYEGKASDYARVDGGYLDNVSTAFAPRYHEEMVRTMFSSSAVALVEDFHVDGFRVDQTTSIHAYNVLHSDNRVSIADANIFGAKFLREWTRTLRLVRPDVVLIAEDHSTWRDVTEVAGDGLGFDARWYAEFYHHLIGDKSDSGPQYARLLHVAGTGYEGPLALGYFAGALAASGGKKIVYYESHDEAGNSPGTHRTLVVAAGAGALDGSARRYAEARVRLVAGLTLLSAGTPMLLFGEELGATKQFLYGKVLENREDLLALKASSGKQLFAYHRDLIALRRSHVALRSRNIRIVYLNEADRVLVFRRWEADVEFLIVASFRNEPFTSGYVFSGVDVPAGEWREVFNTDRSPYGGAEAISRGATLRVASGSFETRVPANGLVVFRRTQ